MAISVPDDLFEAVDRAARKLGISHSELFARAAHAYLEPHSPDEIRRSYDRAFAEHESEEDARMRRRAARAVLSKAEW